MTKPQRPHPSKDDLGARIRSAQERRAGIRTAKRRAEDQRGLAFALRTGVDLVAGIVLGVIVGVLLDRWLETSPWFLLLFFLVGSAAGFLNVFRTIRGYGYSVGYRKNNGDEPPQERDGKAPETAASGRDPAEGSGR